MESQHLDQDQQKYAFVLAGKISDASYHKCLECLKFLAKDRPKQISYEALPFFET